MTLCGFCASRRDRVFRLSCVALVCRHDSLREFLSVGGSALRMGTVQTISLESTEGVGEVRTGVGQVGALEVKR